VVRWLREGTRGGGGRCQQEVRGLRLEGTKLRAAGRGEEETVVRRLCSEDDRAGAGGRSGRAGAGPGAGGRDGDGDGAVRRLRRGAERAGPSLAIATPGNRSWGPRNIHYGEDSL
jgi:hypothetical protein